jgi:hypothetical protein
VHTVLVDMRERLRRSKRPNRIFEAALAVAKEAGLVGRKRVLDSTALYDAVATQDTVTMIRAAIRGLFRVAAKLGTALRAALRRDDGGRRARIRGREKIRHDFALLAAATNLARLAVLSVT